MQPPAANPTHDEGPAEDSSTGDLEAQMRRLLRTLTVTVNLKPQASP